MKYKQLYSEFEPGLPGLFPLTITVMPQVPL